MVIRKNKEKIMKKNILFICTGNSVRSQMAHALFNDLTNFKHNVYSGGVKPYKVHDITKKVMADINISMLDHRANHVEEYVDIKFDYVIVLCEMAFLSIPKFKGEHQLLLNGFWMIRYELLAVPNVKKKHLLLHGN